MAEIKTALSVAIIASIGKGEKAARAKEIAYRRDRQALRLLRAELFLPCL